MSSALCGVNGADPQSYTLKTHLFKNFSDLVSLGENKW